MAARHYVEALESSRQKTDLWLKDVQRELHSREKHHAYSALRAVLHTLRDCMPVEETAKLAGQMPLILKGVFFDGWRPRKPERLTRAEFYARVRERLRGVGLDGALATRAVLLSLDRHVSAGELEGLRRVLPHEVRLMWRAQLEAPGGPSEEDEEREGPELSGPGAGAAPVWP